MGGGWFQPIGSIIDETLFYWGIDHEKNLTILYYLSGYFYELASDAEWSPVKVLPINPPNVSEVDV